MNNVKESILIVDDELMLANLYAEYLSSEGFTTQIARDGEEALQVIKHSTIDILLTDFNMPNLNGLELIMKLRQDLQFDSIKIIIMTGEKNNKTACHAIQLSDEFIEKPFGLERLSSVLKSIQIR